MHPVSCRLRQIRNNTLFKVVFSPPNVSTLKPHFITLWQFFCAAVVIVWSRKYGLFNLKTIAIVNLNHHAQKVVCRQDTGQPAVRGVAWEPHMTQLL